MISKTTKQQRLLTAARRETLTMLKTVKDHVHGNVLLKHDDRFEFGHPARGLCMGWLGLKIGNVEFVANGTSAASLMVRADKNLTCDAKLTFSGTQFEITVHVDNYEDDCLFAYEICWT